MYLKFKRMPAILLAFILVFSSLPVSAATLSPGIHHETISTTVGGYPQKVNKLSIDVTNPYTKIEYGVSNPINTLKTVTNLSKEHTYPSHNVVGAINASFFTYANRYPAYLLAKNDQIVNLGRVSTNFNDYMYVPAAFGVTAENKAKVGRYSLERTIEHNGLSFTTTDMNRERANNELILYTEGFREDKTRQNQYGIEVVVTGVPKKVDSELTFGEKVTGKVSAIRPYGQYTSSTIPKDGFVLSAQGTETSKISSMKIGDDVSLTIDVDAAWKGSQFMLASGPLLVQEGKSALTIDVAASRATERTSRTAVATDATGSRAYFVTVDGRQSGYSQGMTLLEFSKYLVSIGAYNALNLDGGGSTAMVTRRYGNVYPSLINRPSDGSERSVSAILEAISTAPYGQATHVNVSQDQEGIVAVGASLGFKVNYVLDQFYNPLIVDSTKLELQEVSDGIGKIENNRFVGLKAGTGTIIAKYDTATVSIPITVTDTIDQLVASPSEVRVGLGESASFQVNGISKNQKVIFNPAAVSWTTTGGVGTLNGTTFNSGNTEATGSITGTFGAARVSIPVTVSNKPLQVSGLESLTGLKSETIRSSATIGLEKTLQSKEGSGSIKLSYDFSSYVDGTSASYMTWTNGLSIPAAPKKIGAWVYGDGANHWLRAAITDVNGRETTMDLTPEGGLNWVGWKYVEATIPSNVQSPVKLNKIYIAETSASKKGKGAIWIDQVQAVYSNQPDLAKSFIPSSTARVVDINKQFTVTFNQQMNSNYFNTKHVYVEDEFGTRQNVAVRMGIDSTKVVVSAPTGGYVKGKSYRLVVTHFVPNGKGVRMVKDSITEFKVQ
ncbi:phosphodiester glycosidase family protein [Paenisporosarcina quisquiliarum]|uniref:Phosphodiester glycosidase family protein n=1 Tax=Paenisporosarcina quisquiliarum TaxID=365346 RepID=A0A9X3LFZ5_9BACL|nr:phosphodiester glycosidase family protein [Paenisporosarcina quisquiliarum]MCZ8536629.1 phosphodiester glycosidase family protein [Paenisporosarcina quisquiliarum]